MATTDFTTSAQATTSASSLYANPASTTSLIAEIELHNTNTTTETVEFHVVPNSGGSVGTATAATRKFKQLLAADETWIYKGFPYVLENTNDSMQFATTTASKVNVTIKGVKVT